MLITSEPARPIAGEALEQGAESQDMATGNSKHPTETLTKEAKAPSAPEDEAAEEVAEPGSALLPASLPETVVEQGMEKEDVEAKSLPAAMDDTAAKTQVVDQNPQADLEPAKPESSNIEDKKLAFKAGFNLMHFYYKEFDTNDNVLDSEKGFLPGVRLGLVHSEENRFLELDFTYLTGEVDYSGHTVSTTPSLHGLPITTRTDTEITDINLLLGQYDELDSGYRYAWYVGIGYHHWRRHIFSTVTSTNVRVAGILEFYSWFYGSVGGRFPIINTDVSDAQIDVRLTRMLMAKIEVDFLGYQNYDPTTLKLGEKWGLRLAAPWTLFKTKKYPVTIEPYFVLWDIGRSHVQNVTSNGVNTGETVVEPRSETRNFGLSVYLNF